MRERFSRGLFILGLLALCSGCGSDSSSSASSPATAQDPNPFPKPSGTPVPPGQAVSGIQSMAGIWVSSCEDSEMDVPNLEYARHEFQISNDGRAIMRVMHFFGDSRCQYENLERRDVYGVPPLPASVPGMDLRQGVVIIGPKTLTSETLTPRSSGMVEPFNRIGQCGARWSLDTPVSTLRTRCPTAAA